MGSEPEYKFLAAIQWCKKKFNTFKAEERRKVKYYVNHTILYNAVLYHRFLVSHPTAILLLTVQQNLQGAL